MTKKELKHYIKSEIGGIKANKDKLIRQRRNMRMNTKYKLKDTWMTFNSFDINHANSCLEVYLKLDKKTKGW